MNNDKYRLICNINGYAIFSQNYYPSGDKSFLQQVSRWYVYKKVALKVLAKIQKNTLS